MDGCDGSGSEVVPPYTWNCINALSREVFDYFRVSLRNMALTGQDLYHWKMTKL